MTNDALYLRGLWIDSVIRLVGVDEHYVSRKFDKAFERCATQLRKLPRVRWIDFVEAQIQWCIDNQSKILFPNLLNGEKAWQRFRAYPTRDERVEILRAELLYQEAAFNRVRELRGFEAALNNPLAEYTPVFVVYILTKNNERILGEHIEAARRELTKRPLLEEIVPEDILEVLHAKS